MANVKLLCTDSRNEDGTEIIKEFELEYAQRILDVKHPNKGWKLNDADYTMQNGKITALKPNPDAKKVK